MMGYFQKLFGFLMDSLGIITDIERSPLRELGFHRSHIAFQILAFMWAVIFTVIFIQNVYLFVLISFSHLLIVSGIFITTAIFRQAKEREKKISEHVGKILDENLEKERKLQEMIKR